MDTNFGSVFFSYPVLYLNGRLKLMDRLFIPIYIYLGFGYELWLYDGFVPRLHIL